MDFIKKFIRYSRFSTGDFEKIFADFQVPPCPQVVLTLMDKLRNPDIDIDQIVPVLESDTSLAAQILKVVNSALYGLPAQITTISKAVSILGLKEIKNIAIGYAMIKAAEDPDWEEFDMARFWSDSILQALFARNCALLLGTEAEEAFSAALLQDIAVPRLISQWFDLYSKVYSRCQRNGRDIHLMEMESFSWNHCQAGAWIARKWGLPDIIICCIGLHGAPQADIKELNLNNTAVSPVALSSRLTQAGFSEAATSQLVQEADDAGVNLDSLMKITEQSEMLVDELASAFAVKIAQRPSVAESIARLKE